MASFRVQRDAVAGLCGSCGGCETQITVAGQTIVRCAINNGRRVPEPLAVCSDYRRKGIFDRGALSWMRDTAWVPVEHRVGKKFVKTFISPEDASDAVTQQIGFGAKWARDKAHK